jgi:replication factor C small subunit
MTNSQSITLLEKHEPTSLDGIIGQTNIVKILRGFTKTGNIPHMIFSGLPGTGKTTIARVIARELFGKYWQKNIIMLNSSSERGIDIIRGKVKDSTMYQPIGDANYKIIFMDEADELTTPAMYALRETMLRHQNITRFIFAVNNINKMIPPIIDRCQVFKFRSIPHDNHCERRENQCLAATLDVNFSSCSWINASCNQLPSKPFRTRRNN